MIYQKMLNTMKLQANLADNKISTKIGTIVNYDPNNYLAIVELHPSDDDEKAKQTGWLPIGSLWTGNGWGLFSPVNIGDICEVFFQEGSLGNGYIGARYFNNIFRRPLAVPAGEFWIVHENGSYLKFTNDEKVSINGIAEIDMTTPILNINCATSATITAPTVNLGEGPFEALINGLAASIYNTHTHNYSDGTTDAPNQVWGASEQTTHVKAS